MPPKPVAPFAPTPALIETQDINPLINKQNIDGLVKYLFDRQIRSRKRSDRLKELEAETSRIEARISGLEAEINGLWQSLGDVEVETNELREQRVGDADFRLLYAILAASDPPIQTGDLTGGAQVKKKGDRAMKKARDKEIA